MQSDAGIGIFSGWRLAVWVLIPVAVFGYFAWPTIYCSLLCNRPIAQGDYQESLARLFPYAARNYPPSLEVRSCRRRLTPNDREYLEIIGCRVHLGTHVFPQLLGAGKHYGSWSISRIEAAIAVPQLEPGFQVSELHSESPPELWPVGATLVFTNDDQTELAAFARLR
jgi:hypothetical protein